MEQQPRRELPPHVAAAMDELKAAMDELKAALSELYGGRLCGVYLYGSYARGDFCLESDVDVLVVLAGVVKPGAEISRMNPLVSDICLKHDLLISILPVSAETLDRGLDFFFDQVRREAVTV
jgi:predicted nucleotidyltransferase